MPVENFANPFLGQLGIVMRDDDLFVDAFTNFLGGNCFQSMRGLVEVIPGKKGKGEYRAAHLGSPEFATVWHQ